MALQSTLKFLTLLSSVPFAWAANYAYSPLTAGATYSGDGWAPFCFDNAAACWDGCFALWATEQSSTPQVYTYKFAVPSTHWSWYGYKTPGYGSAKVCFDGATTGCDTVSWSNNSATVGLDLSVLLYTKSGLSNAIHTVRITNIPDNTGTTGLLSIDHMEIDGGVPHFPSNTFVSTAPVVAEQYRVGMSFGSTAEPSNVLLDIGGGGGGILFWVGCEPAESCEGHVDYVPSPYMVNLTQSDGICYGNDQNCMNGWRVNDTFVFGSLTATATWDALYWVADPQNGDGNMGMSKTYWFQSQCSGAQNFVELAYAHGSISAPVAAFYVVNPQDNAAAGLHSLVQIGGVDQNKYTGPIDWVPMTGDSFWISPSQTRTARLSPSHAPVTAPNNWPKILFDTGASTLLAIADDDYYALADAFDAFFTVDGTWWWPCQSSVTLMMHGTQNREYTIDLADPTQPNSDNSAYCASVIDSPGSGNTYWFMGARFMSQYYMILEYRANLMGFATKNLAASAATVNPLQQSG